jgi:hypothetical protein
MSTIEIPLLVLKIQYVAKISQYVLRIGHELDDRGIGIRLPEVQEVIYYLLRPHRLWNSSFLPSTGTRGRIARGKAVGS